jgi:hypothetical protein
MGGFTVALLGAGAVVVDIRPFSFCRSSQNSDISVEFVITSAARDLLFERLQGKADTSRAEARSE